MDRLMAFMEARDRTTPQVLAERFPSPTQLDALLFRDPNNINLRFCAVANTMREMNPDHIVVTGDLTDDAEGFELILAGLEPFFEQERVSFVPGNHDTYASPPLWVAKTHRKSEAEKRMLWATFASSLGQPATGSHIRLLGEGVVLACLDSCHHARVPGSASGLVPLRDLRKVESQLDSKGSQIRLACLHHHVLNPPSRGVGRVPMQAGMRLRNAKQVFTCLKEMGFKLVMNGHRHIGYRFHPPMAPLFLSSPSSTIGCRSGESPFFWRIKVDSEGIHGVEEVPIAANQWVCPTPVPYRAEPSP
jgi:predicted MPP superfamily phosphohydrolase